MDETEAKFLLSPMGINYRRGKRAAWCLFGICVVMVLIMITFLPACELLETPAVKGCHYAGVSFDPFISLFLFFGYMLAIGLSVTLGILKYILMTWFLLKSKPLSPKD